MREFVCDKVVGRCTSHEAAGGIQFDSQLVYFRNNKYILHRMMSD
jgi:hypothetical protein